MGIVGTKLVIISCRRRPACVGVGGHVGSYRGDLRKSDPIGRKFNLETAFIGRVICPSQIDLGTGNGRGRRIARGVGWWGRGGAGGVGVGGVAIGIIGRNVVV